MGEVVYTVEPVFLASVPLLFGTLGEIVTEKAGRMRLIGKEWIY